jgi:hypothetical protein
VCIRATVTGRRLVLWCSFVLSRRGWRWEVQVTRANTYAKRKKEICCAAELTLSFDFAFS